MKNDQRPCAGMTGTAAGEAGRVQITEDLRLLQPGLTSSERAWRAKKLFEAEKLKEQVSYNLGPKRWNLRPGVGVEKTRGRMRGSVQQVTKYTRLLLRGNIQVTDRD